VDNKPRVLVAGIGGASLGTEILKSLALAGRYSVFGCDVSRLAYGHYCKDFEETFLVDRQRYADAVLAACQARAIRVIIPGGEEPLRLLNEGRERFGQAGIELAGDSAKVIQLCSDKEATFAALEELGFEIPLTVAATSAVDLANMRYPCVIKPAKGSGDPG
jgi:carbamoyl-phosphate synthase large subunit